MKLKSEGGQGGKRGHSNMVHYAKTEEVKKAARRQRRVEARDSVRLALLPNRSS
jgi:hypothetical protein